MSFETIAELAEGVARALKAAPVNIAISEGDPGDVNVLILAANETAVSASLAGYAFAFALTPALAARIYSQVVCAWSAFAVTLH